MTVQVKKEKRAIAPHNFSDCKFEQFSGMIHLYPAPEVDVCPVMENGIIKGSY
jgi:hypothetical protein